MKERLARIYDNIAGICRRVGRDPAEITLVGVTKYSESARIQEALDCGLAHIGENRVQDAQQKFSLLKFPAGVTKHLLGHLQTNKVKVAVGLFDLFQSVDSLRLAEEIEKQAAKLNRTVDILIQVNCSGEEQKSGASKPEALDLMDRVADLEHVRIKGLMTMAPLTEDKTLVRQAFRDLRLIRDQAVPLLKRKGRGEMKYLSMGMSQDYEIALEEGATMLRIGSAIFGK